MDSDEEMSELEQQRLKNRKMMEEMLKEELDDANLDGQIQELNEFARRTIKRPRVRVHKKEDETFRFTGKIPILRRKSSRIAKLPAEYSMLDDIEDIENNKFKATDDNYDDIETVKFAPLRRRKVTRDSLNNPAVFLSVEEITPEYIKNIAERSTNKTYSEHGSSCHQCRQKTIDSKTYCRSGRCVGVRGQFCGPCLLNRYGEEAKVVLMDPNWSCPPCRGVCNCSICRNREGKMPTGILAPIAQAQGHKSVFDFLKTISDETQRKIKKKSRPIHVVEGWSDEEALLGFDGDQHAIYEGPVCEDKENKIAFDGTYYTYRVILDILVPSKRPVVV